MGKFRKKVRGGKQQKTNHTKKVENCKVRCDEGIKEKLSTCKMEPTVEGRSLSVNFCLIVMSTLKLIGRAKFHISCGRLEVLYIHSIDHIVMI